MDGCIAEQLLFSPGISSEGCTIAHMNTEPEKIPPPPQCTETEHGTMVLYEDRDGHIRTKCERCGKELA